MRILKFPTIRERVAMLDNNPEGVGVKEAGRRGGLATLSRYGHDRFRTIGRLGGERTKQFYGQLSRNSANEVDVSGGQLLRRTPAKGTHE